MGDKGLNQGEKSTKKLKKAIIKIILGILSIIISLLGGMSIGKNAVIKNINSSIVSNISGDNNNVSINNVEDLVNKYNDSLKTIASLTEKNDTYFADYNDLKKKYEEISKEADGKTAVTYKNCGLYVDSVQQQVATDKSVINVDGVSYFSKGIISALAGSDKKVSMDNENIYIGKVVADKVSLFSDKIWVIEKRNSYNNVTKTDSRGNIHANSLYLEYDSSYIIYNTNKKYKYISFILSIEKDAYNSSSVKVSLKDQDNNVLYVQEISKLSEPIQITDVDINNCSSLKIEISGNSGHCIVSDAYLYN